MDFCYVWPVDSKYTRIAYYLFVYTYCPVYLHLGN